MKILSGKNFILLFFFLAVTLFSAAKLLPYFFEKIPYTHYDNHPYSLKTNIQGDHLQWFYHLNLFEKAVKGSVPWFSEGYQFTTPYQLKFINLYFPPQGQLDYIFSFLGATGAYNFLILLSTFISLLGGYAYFKTLQLNSWGALISALIFTFFPYRVSALYGGHPAGMFIPYIPLFFFFFEKTLVSKSLTASFLCGFLLFCFGVSEPHYYYYLMLLLPFYVLYVYIREHYPPSLSDLDSDFFSRVKNYPALSFKDRFLLFNALAALFSFFLIFGLRRAEGSFVPVLLLSLLGTAAAYGLLSILTFRMLNLSGSDFQISQLLKKMHTLCLPFYLYIIQLVRDIPHLGTLIFGLFVLGFLLQILIPVLIIHYKVMLRKSIQYFTHFSKFIARRLFILLPFLLWVFLSVLYAFHIKNNSLNTSTLSKGRSLSEIKLFSPSLQDLTIPLHPVASKFVHHGFTAYFLGFLGVYLFFRKKSKGALSSSLSVTFIFFTGLFLFSFITSFGPNISIPPLFELARKYIPYFGYIRSPIKIIVFSGFALAILCGYALTHIRNLPLKIILLLCTLAEFLYIQHPYGLCTLDQKNSVLQELKSDKKKGVVLYLPLWSGNSSWESLYQFYSLTTERLMINGYQPAVSKKYVTEVADALYSLNLGILSESQYHLLQKLNVTDIVFHKEAFPKKISPFPHFFTTSNLLKSPYLTLLRYDAPLYHFKLNSSPLSSSQTTYSSAYGIILEGESFLGTSAYTLKDPGASSAAVLCLAPDQNKGVSLEKFFPAGRYQLFCSGKIPLNSEDNSLHLKIKNGEKQNVIDLTHASLKKPVTFSLSQSSFVRFELFNNTSRPLELDYLYILFDSEKDPLLSFSLTDGYYMGELNAEQPVKVLKTDSRLYGQGPAFSGPNRLFEAGSYEVHFQLKGSFEKSEEPVVLLQITNSSGTAVLKEKKLFAENLNSGEFLTIPLPFTLASPQVINFNILYQGKGTLFSKDFSYIRKDA